MWTELRELMKARDWGGLDETEARWLSDFSSRKIISGFMKDKTLGEKRLASMPDRYTNTINTVRGPPVAQPARLIFPIRSNPLRRARGSARSAAR
eukprot:7390902-Prymnesium_polylepis.3